MNIKKYNCSSDFHNEDEEIPNSGSAIQGVVEEATDRTENISGESQNIETHATEIHRTNKRSRGSYNTWTTQEMMYIRTFFENYIKSNTVPSKEQCLQFLVKYNVTRQWNVIKDCVRNLIKRESKKK